MSLSPAQKLEKLRRLAKADNPLAVFARLEELQLASEQLEEAIQEARNAFKEHIETIDSILKQLDQRKLNTEQFQAFGEEIKQALATLKLIPGPKGDKGDSYVLTDQDRQNIASRVKPNTEKLIERTEVIRETPIIKEVAVADTPTQIRDKLESLQDDQRLSISAIHKLEEILDELQKRPTGRGGGGFSYIAMSAHIIDDETPSGSGTVFTIANTPNPISSFKLYRGGARQRVTEDYTLSGRNLTLNVALVSGEILLCDYRT